ncbi:Sad1-interacting factor 3 [Wickerhamomyces ciferrii]|uniref:Sad1-interacting factor 3 n=1 Tax=Wickerhamomyces ciferrii (strain ATCC 14091 / BCRC 22168 / CBS 111 / JCM 3599 / NBRC 0793 / NRRL Y-1031 F-60-10) TaxID=1206466 RepID=K0KSP1_WICCF|nr:Sad1-interacting factor 3 [Wickerhamomyces ciferrii]CCH44343.1 Sad1-interacting factor 3 [Wickerhamomyces ciferrii]
MANRPTSKRSPSILVTDSRNAHNKSAPFAGAAHNNNGSSSLSRSTKLKKRNSGKFSDISVSNLLGDASDVPSGRREERLSTGSLTLGDSLRDQRRRLYTKPFQPLPSRTSKTSQKLVLIPDEDDERSSDPSAFKVPNASRSKAEKMSKEKRAKKLSRVTAYLVSDGFNLDKTASFLSDKHDIYPRLYDEVLYCPYCLPLLPGREGFRIRSNKTGKNTSGVAYMERLIDSSERRDHHYEYYSGVETPEDMNNNYEIDKPETEEANYGPFDPSEPQFFAENVHEDTAAANAKQQEMIKHHAEMFIFNYGVVVFWNFTEIQEKNILGDISFARNESDTKQLVIRPIDEHDIEKEQFHFEYDTETERPRIYNDMITLRSGDHLIKLTMSHAIAQSTKLCRFESRITPILYSVSKLPKRLALTGKLGLKREHLIKKSGKLFKLRVDVNLSSNVLDTPEFFWTFEPSLHPLYNAVKEYLEIDQRVEVLNDRCKVFLEFIDIVADSVAEKNMTRITYMIITIFFLSVIVSFFEIFVRYMIINRNKHHVPDLP